MRWAEAGAPKGVGKMILIGRGKVPLLFKFRSWMCVCMRDKMLDDRLRATFRPWRFGGLACWCDRRTAMAAVEPDDEPATNGRTPRNKPRPAPEG
jgi:hypothetical protein